MGKTISEHFHVCMGGGGASFLDKVFQQRMEHKIIPQCNDRCAKKFWGIPLIVQEIPEISVILFHLIDVIPETHFPILSRVGSRLIL